MSLVLQTGGFDNSAINQTFVCAIKTLKERNITNYGFVISKAPKGDSKNPF